MMLVRFVSIKKVCVAKLACNIIMISHKKWIEEVGNQQLSYYFSITGIPEDIEFLEIIAKKYNGVVVEPSSIYGVILAFNTELTVHPGHRDANIKYPGRVSHIDNSWWGKG